MVHIISIWQLHKKMHVENGLLADTSMLSRSMT